METEERWGHGWSLREHPNPGTFKSTHQPGTPWHTELSIVTTLAHLLEKSHHPR